MMMVRNIFCVLLVNLPMAGKAEMVVASHTIPPRTVLMSEDLAINPGKAAGTFEVPDLLVGMEARVALYAGRPIKQRDVGPPAVVERNQIIRLIYNKGGLQISTEGRSLERAGRGERVRVMNLSSRTTVSGQVLADGSIKVSR